MRDDKVTIAKAIGILLMVAVHGGMQKYGADFIVMFHMPLFFFVSGYCFKEKHLNSLPQFVKKRIKGLYKPYINGRSFFLYCIMFFTILAFTITFMVSMVKFHIFTP